MFLISGGEAPHAERHGVHDGYFRPEGLPPGHDRVVVAHPNYEWTWDDPESAAEAAASVQSSLELDLEPGEQREVTLQTSP